MPRTIVSVSDTHLGTDLADGKAFEDFLESLLPEAARLRLILNGDIVDLWRMSQDDAAEAALPAFKIVSRLLKKGAFVDYVIGNHDHRLIRAIDGKERSPVFNAIPKDVRFHHPFRRVKIRNGPVCVFTHGDLYDMVHFFVETLGRISNHIGIKSAYGFYDGMYSLDAQVYEAMDRVGTRLAMFPGEGDPAQDQVRGVLGDTPRAIARSLTKLPLHKVVTRHEQALGWHGLNARSPMGSRPVKSTFSKPDILVTGHYHLPRIHREDGRVVADDGSWWEGPGSGGSYVRIEDGDVRLGRWPG